MAARSAEFLEVDNDERYQNPPNLHRARSGGYTDYLEEREKWERYGREREMKKYHDQKHSAHTHTTRTSGDRLYVPAFEPAGHRRVRSHGEMKEPSEPAAREYNVREVKPSFVLDSESSKSSQLPIRPPRDVQRPAQRRPTVKVEIHQADNPTTPSRQTSVSRKSASPRSPAAPPQLVLQLANVQNEFSEICTVCARNFHVEPANPLDLTFYKIAEEIRGHGFNLQVWEHVVKLNNLDRIDRSKRKVVELAAKTLDRLLKRATALSDVCARARPRDLKFSPVDELEDGDGREDSDNEAEDKYAAEIGYSCRMLTVCSMPDVTLTIGFEIRAHLESIALQIGTLSRLTRPLQEAAPQAGPEVDAVNRLIDEVDEFFGSNLAIDRYPVDNRVSGKKALDEARLVARSGS